MVYSATFLGFSSLSLANVAATCAANCARTLASACCCTVKGGVLELLDCPEMSGVELLGVPVVLPVKLPEG